MFKYIFSFISNRWQIKAALIDLKYIFWSIWGQRHKLKTKRLTIITSIYSFISSCVSGHNIQKSNIHSTFNSGLVLI